MLSWKLSLSLVAVALLNFGCKSELAMPSGSNSIGNGNGSTLNPLTNPANASQILIGKEVYDSNGNVITGTLDTESLSPNSTAVPAGYYDSDDLRDIDTDLKPENIASGAEIFGVEGDFNVVNTSGTNATPIDMVLGKTAYVNGELVSGSIIPRTMTNSPLLLEGFYPETTLTNIEANLDPLNIKSGVTIFGVPGNSKVIYTHSDSPASSVDILVGKTAFVNGSPVSGEMLNRGSSWNLAIPFPGPGYYGGINPALFTSDVCIGKRLLGSEGTAVCQSNSTDSVNNASAANVRTGKFFWNYLGEKVEGTMTEYGDRDLENDLPGEGYYNSFSNYPTRDKICSGTQILGVWGSASCTTSFGDFISSMAPRSDLLNLPAWAGRQTATISEEVSDSNQFKDNYTLVPDPRYHNDGRYATSTNTLPSTVFMTAKQHYLDVIVGRPNTVCGLSGDIKTRIEDCDSKNSVRAFYDGKKYGQNGEGNWRLVTAYKTSSSSGDSCAGSCFEVWRDERTQLLWSDKSNKLYNWCQASGYASATSSTTFLSFQCQAELTGSLQQTPTSACAETGTLSGFSFITNEQINAKGNMQDPTVKWRLPTIHDWKMAEVNGIRKVVPNISAVTDLFWSATARTSTSGLRVGSAWYFSGSDGIVQFASLNDSTNYFVRCIGQ